MKLSDLDFNKTYTYADYVEWTFDEMVELIKGRIFPMAAPLSNHQKTVGNFHRLFANYLHKKPCNVYPAPFDVRLPKPISQRKTDKDIKTVVQPDIAIICDLAKIDRRGCLGAPDLIVEILSKSTAGKDVKDKLRYMKNRALENTGLRA